MSTKRLWFSRIAQFLLSVAFTLALVQSASAGRTCVQAVFEHFIGKPLFDSAIELELKRTPALLDLLTTTDGKVSGVLRDKEVPKFFVDWAREKHPGAANPAEITWDTLPRKIKLQLLREVSRYRVFADDRVFHGVVVKGKIRVRFEKPTQLFGVRYRAGTHTIDVSSLFKEEVHYQGPQSLRSISGLEIHARGRLRPGTLSRDAWRFLEMVGIERPGQHAHIVAPFPLEAFKADPFGETASFVDFYRRANLAAEMLGIMRGTAIRMKGSHFGTIYFNYLGDGRLAFLTQELLAAARESRPIRLGYELKAVAIGLRDGNTYDAPGLYGLEVRTLGKNSDPDVNAGLLDSLQWSMNEREYGVARERIKTWLKTQKKAGVPLDALMPNILAGTWYNRFDYDHFNMRKFLRPELEAAIQNAENEALLLDLGKQHNEIRMLFHDWSQDPLFFDRPEAARRILDAQVREIGKLLGKAPPNKTMRSFLEESGLLQEVIESLGGKIKKPF